MKIDRAVLAASWRSWISDDNRGRAGPVWLQWAWTLLLCAVIALAFTLLGFFAFSRGRESWGTAAGWAHWYGRNLIVSLSIGVLIHLLFDLGRRLGARPARVRAWRPWQRSLYFAGTPLLGVLVGWPLGVMLAGFDLVGWLGAGGRGLMATSLGLSVLLTLFFHHYFSTKARQYEAEKRATEAQLRLLQAQIEPHFLFNTLANVHGLLDHDLPRARQMLAAFTEYLRCSLGTLRLEESPLAQELELARHYLLLLQARMEDRLQFSIEADEASRRQRLPPLLLQPLVENAVQHGLEPSIRGGRVSVRAHVAAGQLVLEVHDDGLGPDAPPRLGRRPGAGLALANIRQRLQARYGSEATLELRAAQPGTLARITLPLQPGAT
jgi:hypothetical protein